MRDLALAPLEHFRRHDPRVYQLYGHAGGSDVGAFWLPAGTKFHGYKSKAAMSIVATRGMGWDHVSVSCKVRCPNWDEMALVHRLFFEADEIAIQYCMPKDRHINNQPHTLHLWRPLDAEIPTPPEEFV